MADKLTAMRDAVDGVAFMRAGLDAIARRMHDIGNEHARARITAYCEQIIDQAEALTALCDELTHKENPTEPLSTICTGTETCKDSSHD